MRDQQAQVLKNRRIELGLTQQEIAVELGMHIRQYQRFEYGEQSLAKCSMQTGLRICSLLHLNPYELYAGSGSEGETFRAHDEAA